MRAPKRTEPVPFSNTLIFALTTSFRATRRESGHDGEDHTEPTCRYSALSNATTA
jgi:hypothetical protein